MDEEGWITCPEVINILADARAFMVGDLIRIQPAPKGKVGLKAAFSEDVDWKAVQLVTYIPTAVWPYCCCISGHGKDDCWWLSKENITAWKRPT